MQHELKQVEVRLKLTDKAGVFQSEGCIGLIPIVIEIGFETVVVQYHMHEVHFVI